MSLDVSLKVSKPVVKSGSGVFIKDNDKNIELTIDQIKERFPESEVITEEVFATDIVFEYNITHNLGLMATAANIYMELWLPEEIGITKARDLINPLTDGLHRLKSNPDKYKEFNPKNGWGNYEVLVGFVSRYLDACYEYPEADVEVYR